MELRAVVEEFAGHIVSLLEAQATEKAKAEILSAFGVGAPRKPGRPPKTAVAVATVATTVAAKVRKKMPPQYCPVPYCRKLAAPALGMVCSKHRDVPKATIKQYREERRAKKDGVKPAKKALTKRVVKKTTRAAPPATKMTSTKRTAPVAKKAAKRRPAATKERTKKTEPLAKEAPSAAPPVVTAA